jgi:4-carboxymuconolactone decarboxylase
MKDDLHEKGMATRRKVVGEAHIKKRAAGGDRFTTAQYEVCTQAAWGLVWSRETLPLKTRSLVTIAMCTAINREDELEGHVNGALNNGATPEEISEVILHGAVYLGWPASNSAMRVAVKVFGERGLL